MPARTVQYPSKAAPGYHCCLVEGSSFDECQRKVSDIMDQAEHATFSLPVKAALGTYVAFGRYRTPDLFTTTEN